MLKLVRSRHKGNKYWYIRGTIAGQRVEESTGITDKKTAERYLEVHAPKIRARYEGSGEPLTYREAVDIYIADKQPSKYEALVHRKIQDVIGDLKLSEVNQSSVVRIVDEFYAGMKASTKNRWAVRTIAGVMHYSAENGHCGWVRFKKFKEEKPKPRAVTKQTSHKIIAAAKKQASKPKLKHLLCLWLFKHGNRISETLTITGQHINLKAKTFDLYISKTKRWKTFPMHSEVIKALRKAYPKELPEGRIFPWETRWGVYKWLLPMCKSIGITFSPHMARHSVGTWYSQHGASIRTIMERLGHDDMKSSMRYQQGDIETVRAIGEKI